LVQTQYVAFAQELRGVGEASFVERVLELDEHGYGDKSDLYRTLARELDLPAALAASLVGDFWRRYHDFCRPFPDVRHTLERLRRRGMKIGLITNGRTSIQGGTIEALRVRDLLDAVLISESEGVRKPGRAIFERAAARLDVHLTECCHVGDHPLVDAAGAVAAGMKAVWKRVPVLACTCRARARDFGAQRAPSPGVVAIRVDALGAPAWSTR
jgi:putative hydrolase of the HAD superfamily